MDTIQHHGVLGMKWGVRKDRQSGIKTASSNHSDDDGITLKKGSEIHRVIPKKWLDKEIGYSGHAYASHTKEDLERYKMFARIFGDGNNYIDMNFKVTKNMVSPSTKKRVDEFIKLMDSNPKARQAMIKATRKPLMFMSKKHLDKLDNPKSADKAYRKFAYLLVSQRDLRDPYFKSLEKQGYTMITDDADKMNGVSKSPIIVFDRSKSLKLKSTEKVGY